MRESLTIELVRRLLQRMKRSKVRVISPLRPPDQRPQMLEKKQDGSGLIDLNPDAVKRLQPSAENSAEWPLVTLIGVHEATANGTVEQLVKRLGRAN